MQPVLGGFDSANYRTERLWAVAPDGVRVPVSLVYHKRLAKLDGSDPLLLNGSAAKPPHLAFRTCNLRTVRRDSRYAEDRSL